MPKMPKRSSSLTFAEKMLLNDSENYIGVMDSRSMFIASKCQRHHAVPVNIKISFIACGSLEAIRF